MKLKIKNGDQAEYLSAEQKNCINNKPNNLYDDLCETQDRIEKQDAELSYPQTPNDLSPKGKREYDVQSTLVNLSRDFEILAELGVDRTIIADTLINSMSRYNLSVLAGDIDSFLRSPQY
jgi:hypothetical protein